ncbi:hypothetical protein AB0G74_24655 [Streptomyces sp. NPDC020875]|uniref:hypothetical protein n=1 Tax=Streptomyces sp. NPDC020875 TaxID=3154898 RepID=UPI0033CAD02F
MAQGTRSPRARTRFVRRTAVVVPAFSALALALAPPAGAAAGPGGDGGSDPGAMPKAGAFAGDRALKSVSEVTRLCGLRDRHTCSFRLDPKRAREYTSAVYSVANGAINCTNEPMTVKRTVTLESSSTDNIGGEVSGSGTVEGEVATDNEVSGSGTGTVQAQQTHEESDKASETKEGTGKISTTNHTAPKDKGPNQETTVEGEAKTSVTAEHTTTNTDQMTETGSTTVASRSNIHLALKGAFTAAFKGTWNRTWSMTNTETTEVTFTIKANDELQFGALNAMTRTVGDLVVDGTDKLVRNVAVDGPSTVNSSTVVAQTFTNPDKCQSLRPSGAQARQPDDEPGTNRAAVPRTTPRVLTGSYVLAPDRSTWRRTG